MHRPLFPEKSGGNRFMPEGPSDAAWSSEKRGGGNYVRLSPATSSLFALSSFLEKLLLKAFDT